MANVLQWLTKDIIYSTKLFFFSSFTFVPLSSPPSTEDILDLSQNFSQSPGFFVSCSTDKQDQGKPKIYLLPFTNYNLITIRHDLKVRQMNAFSSPYPICNVSLDTSDIGVKPVFWLYLIQPFNNQPFLT